MSLPVRITAREQVGDRIVLHTVEGETFEEALESLRKLWADKTATDVGPFAVDNAAVAT